MGFTRFEDVGGREVYVNADHVTLIRYLADDATAIHVIGSEDSAFKVSMKPADVAAQLARVGRS